MTETFFGLGCVQASRLLEGREQREKKKNGRGEDVRGGRRMGGWGRDDDGGGTAGEEKKWSDAGAGARKHSVKGGRN